MTLPVFLGTETRPSLDEVRPGSLVTLGGDEGRHAAKVRRMSIGEWLDIVDGHGLRIRGVITDVASSQVCVRVEDRIEEPTPRTRLVLIQALAKGGRDEQAIESATEIGVDAVIPWQSDRSIVKWLGVKSEKGVNKWESVLTAAAKQSRRSHIPSVHKPLDSRALGQWISQVCADGGIVYLAHEGAVRRLSEDLRLREWSHLARRGGDEFAVEAGVPNPVDAERIEGALVAETPPGYLAVIIGPEGGLTDAERELFTSKGAIEVLLGPHVLRSSSAGSCALTLMSAAIGRW